MFVIISCNPVRFKKRKACDLYQRKTIVNNLYILAAIWNSSPRRNLFLKQTERSWFKHAETKRNEQYKVCKLELQSITRLPVWFWYSRRLNTEVSLRLVCLEFLIHYYHCTLQIKLH